MQIHKGRAALVEMGAQDLEPPVLQAAHRPPQSTQGSRKESQLENPSCKCIRAGVFQAHVVILNLPRRSVPR